MPHNYDIGAAVECINDELLACPHGMEHLSAVRKGSIYRIAGFAPAPCMHCTVLRCTDGSHGLVQRFEPMQAANKSFEEMIGERKGYA